MYTLFSYKDSQPGPYRRLDGHVFISRRLKFTELLNNASTNTNQKRSTYFSLAIVNSKRMMQQLLKPEKPIVKKLPQTTNNQWAWHLLTSGLTVRRAASELY